MKTTPGTSLSRFRFIRLKFELKSNREIFARRNIVDRMVFRSKWFSTENPFPEFSWNLDNRRLTNRTKTIKPGKNNGCARLYGIHSSIASDFQRCFVVEFLPVPPCTREKYEKLRLPAWKKVKRENDEPGVRSRRGRVAIKNCPTFRRRSDSTPIVRTLLFSFSLPFLFFHSLPFFSPFCVE